MKEDQNLGGDTVGQSEYADMEYVPEIDNTITIVDSNSDNAAEGNMLRRYPRGGGVEERVSLNVE